MKVFLFSLGPNPPSKITWCYFYPLWTTVSTGAYKQPPQISFVLMDFFFPKVSWTWSHPQNEVFWTKRIGKKTVSPAKKTTKNNFMCWASRLCFIFKPYIYIYIYTPRTLTNVPQKGVISKGCIFQPSNFQGTFVSLGGSKPSSLGSICCQLKNLKLSMFLLNFNTWNFLKTNRIPMGTNGILLIYLLL